MNTQFTHSIVTSHKEYEIDLNIRGNIVTRF